MINLSDLRANPESYKEACRKKFVDFDIDAFLRLDSSYRSLKRETEDLRAGQNRVSKEIPKLSGADKESKLAEMKTLSAELKDRLGELKALEKEWSSKQLQIPSVPLERVPFGKDDSENVEIRRWGDVSANPSFFKNHIELGKALGIIDIERGVKIAGARNYFLVGDGVRLQHALLNLAKDMLYGKGFTLMDPPHIVNWDAMMGTSYFPGGEEQAYHLDERDDKYLIGTSEVSIASYHSGETLSLEELPKRYGGFSPCYRREAGTYGKDTQGLYRIHQFYKVEQVIVCEGTSEATEAMHAEILANSEELLQHLKLPYRVVDVCTGDMGQGQVYKNDIECWMPSRNSYGETHSCSSFYDFQARRLNLKYKDKEGKKRFCHTLNNTLIASPRILIPILEIYQNEDGSVSIPEVLQPYMQGQEKIG